MMNYMKSELYRVFHTSGVYLVIVILIFVSLLLNIGISCFGNQYATTSFSFSNLVANPMLFVAMGFVISYFLYEGSRKNGNIKNTIASGIIREKIFFGECIISALVASLIMVLTLVAYIVSAILLMEESGPVTLSDLILEVPAVFLIAMASLISGVILNEIFEKNIVGVLAWLAIWFIIPKSLLYIGIRFEHIYDIAMWLPTNMFAQVNGIHVNTKECITVWDNASGWFRCLASGGVGIVVFALSGIFLVRKRDL